MAQQVVEEECPALALPALILGFADPSDSIGLVADIQLPLVTLDFTRRHEVAWPHVLTKPKMAEKACKNDMEVSILIFSYPFCFKHALEIISPQQQHVPGTSGCSSRTIFLKHSFLAFGIVGASWRAVMVGSWFMSWVSSGKFWPTNYCTSLGIAAGVKNWIIGGLCRPPLHAKTLPLFNIVGSTPSGKWIKIDNWYQLIFLKGFQDKIHVSTAELEVSIFQPRAWEKVHRIDFWHRMFEHADEEAPLQLVVVTGAPSMVKAMLGSLTVK